MPKQHEYMSGWIDTSIHHFLSDIDDPTTSMAYALITCLDSDFDVSSLFATSKHLGNLKEKCQSIGDGILLTTRQLLAAEKSNRLLFGFDEIWFFPDSKITPKPSEFVITGPDRISSLEGSKFNKWLRSNKCSLGLGDGIGMNFCLRVRGVAKYIVEAFNDSNHHTLLQDGDFA